MNIVKRKPLHWSWQYFQRENATSSGGKPVVYAKCKFCHQTYANNSDRLTTHLINKVCFIFYGSDI